MSDKLLLEFSGWMTITLCDALFNYVGSDDMPDIDGYQWLALTEEERSDYTLDFDTCNKHSIDGNFEQYDISHELV